MISCVHSFLKCDTIFVDMSCSFAMDSIRATRCDHKNAGLLIDMVLLRYNGSLGSG